MAGLVDSESVYSRSGPQPLTSCRASGLCPHLGAHDGDALRLMYAQTVLRAAVVGRAPRRAGRELPSIFVVMVVLSGSGSIRHVADTRPNRNSPRSWRPEVVSSFNASDLVPYSLLPRASTIAGQVEGDQPALRVPYVSADPTAGLPAEGATISDALPVLDEVVVNTKKIAALVRVGRESVMAGAPISTLFDSFTRTLTRSASTAFLSNAAVSGPSTDLLNLTGVVTATALPSTGNADPLVDAIATIQGNDGMPTTIISSPSAWAAVRKLKATTSATDRSSVTEVATGRPASGCSAARCGLQTRCPRTS
jgi:hypothetical protein